ncbi:hypothetical protein [Pelagicoccus sp. SDUM812005]|uniref:hypothetical protein n=1 Tax=Pelagicoccus sp. SDUM812005 TaxID=3041257 RepID=UPI00281047A4|nr:hypothetical protein [Pelagicoccus sp. SDUM812005]MDQ8180357.1 hypothetical protein [Pelagicoccus sp. SDUM812005]
MIPKKFVGNWTIDETSEWDADFLHMVETAKIEIHPDGMGRFRFGCVETEIDCEPDAWSPQEILHFSFEGGDEGTPVCGRGSVKLEGEHLLGNFAFHLGDRSAFKASKRS